jgi:hypothetical protein
VSKLVANDASPDAGQGESVAISADGLTALVGGDFDAVDGAAWIYTRTGGSWSQMGAKLAQSDGPGQGSQGASVALSADGNTAVVAAPYRDSFLAAGGTWVYSRAGDTWVLLGGKLVGSAAVDPAAQGWSCALSGDGNTLVVGGPGDNSSVGAAWAFARSASAFSDVTSGPLGFTGNGIGGACGDFDGDGDQDLYVPSYGQGNKLFRNDGLAGFVDVTTPLLASPSAAGFCRSVAWGDYDNDGDLDLYLSYVGANALIRNEGGGVFVDVTSGPLGDGGEGVAAAWADYDNDGDLDLYLVRNNQPGETNKLLRNEGGGAFVDATSSPLDDGGQDAGAAWGDYDNDGDLDLYLVSSGGANKLFRNDGGGAFTDVTSGPLGDAGHGECAVWGDYDNDGDLDLYLANSGNVAFPSKLLRNDGGGAFTDVTSGALGNLAAAAAWGDYDDDGDLDLYVGRIGLPNTLLRNDGGGSFVDVTTDPLGNPYNASGVAWADFDNDGDPDLYLANFGTGPQASNRLFRNNAAGNHWLHVRLVGTVSNRSGLGARVRLVAGGLTQVREVSGGAGNQSQSATIGCFGLGGATALTSLQVQWPSGIVQDVELPSGADRTLIVTETVTNAPSSVSAVLPASGGNTGPLTVTIQGHRLPSGTSARLLRSGQPDIPGTNVVAAADGSSLTVSFDLTGALAGPRDVRVTPPLGAPITVAGGFTVEAVAAAQLRVDILGPELIRANFRTAFDVVISNEGNVDATAVPLWLAGIPAGVTVEPDFTVSPPPPAAGEPDWTLAPLVLGGSAGNYLSLVVPRVPPGVVVRRFYLTVPFTVSTLSLRAGLTPPWAENASALASCLAAAGVPRTSPCAVTQLAAIATYAEAHPELSALNGVGVWAQESWRCEGAGSLPASVTSAEQVLEALVRAVELPGALPAICADVAGARWLDTLVVTVVGALDPNEKLGLSGVLAGRQVLPYAIRFENLAGASANAQQVSVLDELDLATMDVNTVSLESITFGGRTLLPVPGRSEYSADVDLRPERNMIVRVTAFLDKPLGKLSWSLLSIDPATQQPLSPLSADGFLPPNRVPPAGEGSVIFTVQPRADVAAGTEIRNRAAITFDKNPTVLTPYWLNTLDNAAPASHVLPLAAGQDSASFTVHWEATDSPPDLLDFTVYVSDDGEAYRVWKQNTTSTAARFTTQPAHQYAFYSVARDVNGNIEPAPATPDAQTLARADAPRDRPLVLALEGTLPNPVSGVIRAWFTLPGTGRATLDLVDVAGRRVVRREVGGLGPGRHSMVLGDAAHIAPGLYWLRLTRAGQVRTARVVVVN